MTRINVVPPSELTREHLIAEHRELPRVFGLAERAHARGEPPPRLRGYRLGEGHVRFFYDRLSYLRNRHARIRDEMARRGYASTMDCWGAGLHLPAEWQRDYIPTPEALRINRARIAARLAGLKN